MYVWRTYGAPCAAAAVLSLFTLLWVLLLKLPAVIAVPSMEAVWLGAGEIAVILAGAWIVFASSANPHGRFLAGRNGVARPANTSR